MAGEMVTVHVDDGTSRGHDRLMTRYDAERLVAVQRGAVIVEATAPDEAETVATKMIEPMEDKAVKRPRARKT